MNKENDFGIWEVKEEAFEVFKNSSVTGWRRTLEFFEFVDYPERKTNWMMREYSITQKGPCGTDKDKVFSRTKLVSISNSVSDIIRPVF